MAARLTPRLILAGVEEKKRLLLVRGSSLIRAESDLYRRRTERLASLSARVSPRAVERLVGEGTKTLERLDGALTRAMKTQIAGKKDRVAQSAKLLDAYNYRRVLDRGFAVIRDEAGTPLRHVAALDEAGTVEIELADGRRKAVVGDGAASTIPSTPPKPARPKRAVDARPTPKQESLFD
ncbi:MAG: exodeoxyribonuclease VII large subunit [Pseudomonadota bacterium]